MAVAVPQSVFWSVNNSAKLECWRVENLCPVKQESQIFDEGFYDEDLYIVLHKYETKRGKKALDIHCLLGRHAPQEEAAGAITLANELDEFLGGGADHYKEVQGSESDEFLQLFPEGIKYLPSREATAMKPVTVQQKAESPQAVAAAKKLGAAAVGQQPVLALAEDWTDVRLSEEDKAEAAALAAAANPVPGLEEPEAITSIGMAEEVQQPSLPVQASPKAVHPAAADGAAATASPQPTSAAESPAGEEVSANGHIGPKRDSLSVRKNVLHGPLLAEEPAPVQSTEAAVEDSKPKTPKPTFPKAAPLAASEAAAPAASAPTPQLATPQVPTFANGPSTANGGGAASPSTPDAPPTANGQHSREAVEESVQHQEVASFWKAQNSPVPSITAHRHRSTPPPIRILTSGNSEDGTGQVGLAQNGKMKWKVYSPKPLMGGANSSALNAHWFRADTGRPHAAPATPAAKEFKLPPGSQTFPAQELKRMRLESGIDPSQKEAYLSDEEFVEVFGQSKAAFVALPAWRKVLLKKNVGLF